MEIFELLVIIITSFTVGFIIGFIIGYIDNFDKFNLERLNPVDREIIEEINKVKTLIKEFKNILRKKNRK